MNYIECVGSIYIYIYMDTTIENDLRNQVRKIRTNSNMHRLDEIKKNNLIGDMSLIRDNCVI